jgi:hypothetical protein
VTPEEFSDMEHGDYVLHVDGRVLPGRWMYSSSGGEGREDLLELDLTKLDGSHVQIRARHEDCIPLPMLAAMLSCGHQARVPASSALPAQAVCPLSSGVLRDVTRYQVWTEPERETRAGYCGPGGWRPASDVQHDCATCRNERAATAQTGTSS